MKRIIIVTAVTLGCGAFSLVGIGQVRSSAQHAVDRVQPFDRLAHRGA